MARMNTLVVLRRRATAAIAVWLFLGFALVCVSQRATAAEARVFLTNAADFAVLAGSFVTNNGQTVVVGNVGVWPGTNVGGFPPGTASGTIHRGDTRAARAQTNLTAAYNDAAGRMNPIAVPAEVGGMTFTPGLYASASSLDITSGDLMLDAQGDPAAVFIFQIGTSFAVAADRQVILTNAARGANVFWQVSDSATLGSRSLVSGNILANQSITLESRATLDGRALARMGAVTLNTNVVTVPLGGTTNDPAVDVFTDTPITLNPQTGLFEQNIRAHNAGSSTNPIQTLIVLIRGLPSDVRVYNASGSSGGTPYVGYKLPLAAGESVNFLIEYYRSTRRIFTQPTFAPSVIPAVTNEPAMHRIIGVTNALYNGRFLIEFSATPGRRYEVQYSHDMTTWKSATPTITAPADRVQWLDDGPPKTESPPASVPMRCYRVVELP